MSRLKTLLLKFSGPLQSWGTDSHFETRYTDFHPSKSAVIGLIAASLGYRRDEDEKIAKLNDLNFAVRVDQRGNLLRDYQIATAYKPDGRFERNYVTNRYYLEDAVFVVALSGEDELIDDIEYAIRNPYFQPFFGKRSNPVNPDIIIKTTTDDIVTSLEKLRWQASKFHKREFKDKEFVELEVYIDGDLIETSSSKFRRDRVKSFSQKHRQFGYRGEKTFTIRVTDEHDAFMFIGGEDVFIKS